MNERTNKVNELEIDIIVAIHEGDYELATLYESELTTLREETDYEG